MIPDHRPIVIATRGSALALAQANFILGECRRKFPQLQFEIKIIKTTGDKLQTASMARIDATLPRGLFTKELEVALIEGQADLAVHSLKDLPTELPPGLKLGAVSEREDVRDVFIFRDAKFLETQPAAQAPRKGFSRKMKVKDFPPGLTVATSSTRRKAQLLATRPDFNVVEIRGNVATRLEKLFNNRAIDAIILAAAGLRRLKFQITPDGELRGDAVPAGCLATVLELDEMLPCVGQAAIGLEIRENDKRIEAICDGLNHLDTFHCVTAERAFLNGMGGGCQAPLGAHAVILGEELRLRVVSFLTEKAQSDEILGPRGNSVDLGFRLSQKMKARNAI